MARKPVTMAIAEEDLLKLDEFRKARRLDRGDAVGVLLEFHSAQGNATEGLRQLVAEAAPAIARQALDLKALKLATGKAVLGAVEQAQGVVPVAIVGDELVQDDADGYDDPGSVETQGDNIPQRVIDRSGDQSTDFDFDQSRKRGR